MLRLGAALALLLTTGCSSFGIPKTPPDCDHDPTDPACSEPTPAKSACSKAADPLNPLVMAAPSRSLAELEGASQSGLVIAAYSGCKLRILPKCRATGNYTYVPIVAERSRANIALEAMTFKLPFGIEGLDAPRKGSESLLLDYAVIGSRLASDAPQKIEGECEGATHFVRSIRLGAFDHLRAGNDYPVSSQADACASIHPGSLDDAAKAHCAVPIALDLVPIRVVEVDDSKEIVAIGFGQNIASMRFDPPDLNSLSLSQKGDDELSASCGALFEEAKRKDADAALSPADRVSAWETVLACDPSSNEKAWWKAVATSRRKSWEEASAADSALKDLFLSDKRLLSSIKEQPDEAFSPEKKRAAAEEFAEVYAPWQGHLQDAMGTAAPSFAIVASEPDEKPKVIVRSRGPSLGTFRVDAEGGLDVQQIAFNATTPIGSAFLTTKGRYVMKGDAGGIGGFGGATVSLPEIPYPGVGLSALFRFAAGADVSRILAGLGMRFDFAKAGANGLVGNAYVSYAKLLHVSGRTPTGCATDPTVDTSGCDAAYSALVDGSKGGVDLRLAVAYQIAIGSIFSIGAGGSVGYLLIPYSATLTPTNLADAKPESVSDIAKGVGATLQAQIGMHL